MSDVNVNVFISHNDSKEQMIQGLASMNVHKAQNGYDIGLSDFLSTRCDWRFLDPKYNDHFFSSKRREKCAAYNILPLSEHPTDINYNMEQRNTFANFVRGDWKKEMLNFTNNIAAWFLSYGNDQKLESNRFRSILSNRAGGNRQGVVPDSFKKATSSEIYVEMIKNAAFLFEVDRILSDFEI